MIAGSGEQSHRSTSPAKGGLDDPEGQQWQDDDWCENGPGDDVEDWMYDQPAAIDEEQVDQALLDVTAATALQGAVERKAGSTQFAKAKSYQGFRLGMVFGKGSKGLGYYLDDGAEACGSGPAAADPDTDLPRAVLSLDSLVKPDDTAEPGHGKVQEARRTEELHAAVIPLRLRRPTSPAK